MTRDPTRGKGEGRAVGSLLSPEIAIVFATLSPRFSLFEAFPIRGILINGLLSVSVRSAALCYGEAPYFIEHLRYESPDVRKRLPIELASAVTHSLDQPGTSR